MNILRKTAAVVSIALVAASLSVLPGHSGEDLGSRLSGRMSLSELSDMVIRWKRREVESKRPILIDLIREGSPVQAQNAALLLRRLPPPFIGVAEVASDGSAAFTKDARTIYDRMVAEETAPRLKLVLDELLMSGSEMLFTFSGQPIRAASQSFSSEKSTEPKAHTYDTDDLAVGDTRVAILEGIARDFPQSRFSPYAEQAVGDVYLEMFLFAESHDIGLLQAAVSAYDKAFRNRIAAEIDGDPDRRLFDDLGIRLAVALTLNGDEGGVNAVLDELDNIVVRNTPAQKKIDQFYVSHFLPFLTERRNLIFNTHDFVTHLRQYLASAEPFDPARYAEMTPQEFSKTLEPLINHLSAFENRDYKVIFMSSTNLTEIMENLAEFQAQIDGANLDIELEQVGGDPWHGISTAGNFTRLEADEIRKRLIAAGLPADAYLWRPRSL